MNQNLKKISRFLPDGFIMGIFTMVLLGYFFPGVGAEGGRFELSTVIHYGIMLLFFFYGLRLSPDKLRADLSNWKLHLTIQSITFLFFPVLVLLFYPFFRSSQYQELWLAVFFLAALPSTVSSSVVMVSIARGNISGAIFNASLSGVIGIVLTPLWMSLFMQSSAGAYDFTSTISNLVIQILIPVIVGLAFHRIWGAWAIRSRRYLSLFDKSVILTIVFKSFSNSFSSGIFSAIPNWILFSLSVVVIVLFFIVYKFSTSVSNVLKFNREDQITVVFCASKKSLVHGSVMASVLFGASASGGLFLVPIMIYHIFQLSYISTVARKMEKEKR
jgi:sodium/bile acid cotransporter 7